MRHLPFIILLDLRFLACLDILEQDLVFPNITASIWEIDPESFQGQIIDGKADGVGNVTLASGVSYHGQWKDGVPHGRGELRIPPRDVYK